MTTLSGGSKHVTWNQRRYNWIKEISESNIAKWSSRMFCRLGTRLAALLQSGFLHVAAVVYMSRFPLVSYSRSVALYCYTSCTAAELPVQCTVDWVHHFINKWYSTCTCMCNLTHVVDESYFRRSYHVSFICSFLCIISISKHFIYTLSLYAG